MESAYIVMLIAIVASFFLAMYTKNNWIAVGLPALTPIVATIARLALAPNPGFGETLLFISPFLVAGTLLYSLICLAAAKAGRNAYAKFGNGSD